MTKLKISRNRFSGWIVLEASIILLEVVYELFDVIFSPNNDVIV